MRSSHDASTAAMKRSREEHSSLVKNTSMEHRRDVLAKNHYLLAEKRTISWAEVARKGVKKYSERADSID